MRYTARKLKQNVNISKKSPLKELFNLFISLISIIIVIYILLGFAVNMIVPLLPDKIDESLGKFYKPLYTNTEKEFNSENTQKLLDNLAKNLENQKKYQVSIIKSKHANALALPGKRIIIFSELLEILESENELAFVLAHELGHYANRDHLKALGRRLVLFTLSSLFLGQDNSVSGFIGNSLTGAEMKFSQTQEKNADLFAIDLLYKKYGHISGAMEFLEKMEKKEKAPKFFYFFATHPHSQKRINTIKNKITELGYTFGKTTPLKKETPLEEKK